MEFLLPELGEGIYEAELISWAVEPGDVVKRGQTLLVVMTDKASMDVPSSFAGKIVETIGKPGDKLRIGQHVLTVEASNNRVEPVAASNDFIFSTVSAKSERAEVVTTKSTQQTHLPVAAPSVRHLARKLGIDLSKVRGSGPSGRILIDDLTPFLQRPVVEATPKANAEQPKLDFGQPGTRVKLTGLRRKIAHHLVDVNRRLPQYSYVDECDVSSMVNLRQSLREPCAKIGVKLTYISFVIKAVTLALKEIPIVNSSLDDDTEEIVFHDHYNIGIAVATPTGLVVPVIHGTDQRDVFDIAREVDRLSLLAKGNKIKVDDLKGGTFTVTSIGNIGGLISTPIINHPEVGIIGIGKVVRRPVYDEHDQLYPADIMYLSFTFDHRVVDGSVGAAFGNIVKRHLENPAALLVPNC